MQFHSIKVDIWKLSKVIALRPISSKLVELVPSIQVHALSIIMQFNVSNSKWYIYLYEVDWLQVYKQSKM